MVSPYLMRPIRSVDEVERDRPKAKRLETIIERALTGSAEAGYPPYEQINRATIAVLRSRPEMSTVDALAAVYRFKRKRDIAARGGVAGLTSVIRS